MGSLFLFLQILYGKGLAQALVESGVKETHESRIILRYESGSAVPLHDRPDLSGPLQHSCVKLREKLREVALHLEF